MKQHFRLVGISVAVLLMHFQSIAKTPIEKKGDITPLDSLKWSERMALSIMKT